MMRKIMVVVLVLLARPVLADEAHHRELAMRLLEANNVGAQLEKLREVFPEMMMQAIPGDVPPEVRDLLVQYNADVLDVVSRHMSTERFLGEVADIYMEVYSEEELEGIVAFARSDAGKAFFASTPELLDRTTALTQALVEEAGAELAVLEEAFTRKLDELDL